MQLGDRMRTELIKFYRKENCRITYCTFQVNLISFRFLKILSILLFDVQRCHIMTIQISILNR